LLSSGHAHSGQLFRARLHGPGHRPAQRSAGREGGVVDTLNSDPARFYDVFQHLCEQPSAAWEAQLAEEFPTDPAARAELLAMLEAASSTGLDTSPMDVMLADAMHALGRLPALQPGACIGGWVVLGVLGEGGMGAVYRVRRADVDCPQTGALKLGERADDASEARLAAEIRILARLTHPGIARLIDSGVVHGRRFFVMELVEGQHIDRAVVGMPLRQRVDLLRQVGEVLAYAHRQLVVHRDLKPSNVMVEQTDAGPRVRLLDFGIARSLDGATARTAAGTMALTLRYAAPEQLRGEHSGTGVDVHGLGLLAYEVLSGRYPFETGGPGEQVRALLEDEPVNLPTAARAAGTFAGDAGLLAGDLDAIVQRALRKEPAARHASAQVLVDDLVAWSERRPVQARAGNTAYRIDRFLRRNWLATAAGSIATIALLALSVVAVERAWHAEHARREAEQVAGFFPALLHDLNPLTSEREVGASLNVLDLLTLAEERLQDAEYPRAARARLMLEIAEGLVRIGSPARAIGLGRAAELIADSPELRVRALRVQAAALGADDTLAAEALLQQALGSIGAGQVPGVAAGIMIDLAGLLSEAARDPEAVPLLRQAIDMLDALPEEASREDLAIAHGLLGDVLQTFGEHQTALDHSLRSLALMRQRYGDGHPRYATRLTSHASTLESLGRIDDAGNAHRQALAIFERSLGADNPSTLSARSNHALWLSRRGDHEGARADFEAVRHGHARRNPDSLGVADASQNLAAMLLRLGQLDEADAAARAAARIYDARLPASSYRPAYPRLTLASIALDGGRPGQAARWAQEAIDRLDATLGADSFPALSARGRLGQAQLALGDCATGTATLQAALDGLTDTDSPVVLGQARLLRESLEKGCVRP
jgi:eukaryotic-like serine/threonine-protein kinase